MELSNEVLIANALRELKSCDHWYSAEFEIKRAIDSVEQIRLGNMRAQEKRSLILSDLSSTLKDPSDRMRAVGEARYWLERLLKFEAGEIL